MSASATLGFRPAAVLFDMDGLLLDSERALLACWREAARGLQTVVDDGVWLSMIGLSDKVCDQLLQDRVGISLAHALRERCHALYDLRVIAGIPVKPGAFELLALLQHHRVPRAVVTSTWRSRNPQSRPPNSSRPGPRFAPRTRCPTTSGRCCATTQVSTSVPATTAASR